MKISVCIPAYNRPEVLSPLLDSIVMQDYDDYNIVICEDCSPKKAQIREIVQGYQKRYPGRIEYFENSENLGYDANLRNLTERAGGEYCFFMGNDDIMCAGALAKVASALERYDNVGVILRSYAVFEGQPENITETFRYFETESFFPSGASTIATFYRRSVVIPGMVVRRDAAVKFATDRFDGVLLYQLYLVANILVDMNGVFLPDIIVLYRSGGIPEFGSSSREKMFVPTVRTPESSIHFMKGMLDIARYVEEERGVHIYKVITRDIGNYSYPILALQSQQPLPVFLKYIWGLANIGLWRSGLFYVYSILILTLRPRRVDKIIRFIKNRLGHTPAIGKVYKGTSV